VRLRLRWVVPLLLAALHSSCAQNPAAPTLSVTCNAVPSTGTAPLTVAFTVNVAGSDSAFTVAASYGDGATGTNPDAPHTYAQAGVFTASFAVTSAKQSARCAATVTVSSALTTPATPTPTPTPTPSSNTKPNAVFKTVPAADSSGRISGPKPFTVHFNMCRTTDPDGDRLEFTMDFQGDGTLEIDGSSGADCRHDFTYSAGTYHPQICVTDVNSSGQPFHKFQCESYTVVAR
jgi:hypothetical protein